MLKHEYLPPLGMTQKELADHLDCDIKVVNRIINGRSSVTTLMALKLAAALGTTPDFWLNAQMAVDLHRAADRAQELPKPLIARGSASREHPLYLDHADRP
jgi:addiction module HigA family antidote